MSKHSQRTRKRLRDITIYLQSYKGFSVGDCVSYVGFPKNREWIIQEIMKNPYKEVIATLSPAGYVFIDENLFHLYKQLKIWST